MIADSGLWYCDECKSVLVEFESWFVEIEKEHLCVDCAAEQLSKLRELKKLVWQNTAVNIDGEKYWPEWVVEHIGYEGWQ